MGSVRRIYVEKKAPYAVRARELKEEVKRYLGIKGLTAVRVLIRYDVENLRKHSSFSCESEKGREQNRGNACAA